MRGIERFVVNPLGIEQFGVRKKGFDPFSAASLGLGVVTSFLGGRSASKASKESLAKLRAEEARENASYLRQYNQDVTDRASGQNLIRMASDIYDRDIKRTAGAKAVAGGTDASVQMAKDARNKAVGDTIANMKAMDDSRKDSIQARHDAAQRSFTQQEMAIENQRAQNITNAAQNASNAIMQMGSAFESSTNLQGGDNKGTDVAPATEAQPISRGAGAPNAIVNAAKDVRGEPTEGEYKDFYNKIFS